MLPSLLRRMTMTSWLSTLTSVPLYLPNSTRASHFGVERAGLPAIHHLASAHGDDFAEGGLFWPESLSHRHFGLALDDHPIVQGTNGHDTSYVPNLYIFYT